MNHDQRFEKIIEHFCAELKTFNIGRAMPALLENIKIDVPSYGTTSKLVELASLQAKDPRTLLIQPWDKSILRDIERGLRTCGEDFSPIIDQNSLRINFPAPTEERRKELVKVLHRKTEEVRVAMRKIREDILKDLKHKKEDGFLSEDDSFRQSKELQNTINTLNKSIDSQRDEKEKEILTV